MEDGKKYCTSNDDNDDDDDDNASKNSNSNKSYSDNRHHHHLRLENGRLGVSFPACAVGIFPGRIVLVT